MSDEQLINLVKRYSVLYDINSSRYRDQTIRNNAWKEIAEQLHITDEKCKERWAKLRNCFTNALKRRLKKRRQGSNIVPWKYETQMKFLLPHVQGRRMTNLSTDVNDESTEELQFLEEPNSPPPKVIYLDSSSASSSSLRAPTPTSEFDTTINRKENNNYYLKEIVDSMKSSQELQQGTMAEMMDETDQLFLSMSKRLKKLPMLEQSTIKFQIHKHIHDAEIRMIKKSEIYEMNTQAVSKNVVFHETDHNLTLKPPNTLNPNVIKTEKVNAHNERNSQHGDDNVLIIERLSSPINIIEMMTHETT